MWQLVKFEVQKLLSKKMVWACLLGMAFMICAMIANWVYPGEVRVRYFQDGELITLEGTEAIRFSQAIAEKYGGLLTDEKVQAVLAEYRMKEEDMIENHMDPTREGYYIHNFLYDSFRDFYQGDGTYNGAGITEVYGELAESLTVGFSSGWVNLIYAMIYTLLSLGCVLTIILAPLFAEEYTRGMDALILTGAYGKTKCAWAKIMAGFLVSMGLMAVHILIFTVVYLCFYGFDGWNASIQINDLGVFMDVPYLMSCGQGLLYALLLWFTAGLILTGMSILISAWAKSAFNSLIISFALFVVPLFLPWNYMGILKIPAKFFPILQMQLSDLFEAPLLETGKWQINFMWLTVPIALIAAAVCGIGSRRIFARHQVTG